MLQELTSHNTFWFKKSHFVTKANPCMNHSSYANKTQFTITIP